MPLRRLCALLSLALPLCAQQQPAPAPQHFTVAEALSTPFMNQLTAAPAKARVAWFVDQEGRRNVWVASPTEAAHAITHYTNDDGQDIDDITWSPDAEAVAYTHGTGSEGSEHPTAANPAHLQTDVQQRVEVATVSGNVRIVGEGHSPLFSADGKQLYFIRHGQVWFANLTTAPAQVTEKASDPTSPRGMGHPSPSRIHSERSDASTRHPERSAAESKDLLSSEAAQLPNPMSLRDMGHPLAAAAQASSYDTGGAPRLASETWDTNSSSPTEGAPQQLIHAHGTASQLRLSPDGTKLALTSHRGDHSFIGVFDLKAKTLTYVDPGTGLDHDAAWSPDSKRIVFLRESPVVSELDLRWMRSVPVPWSIRVADVATGEGKQVWQADAGTGSLFHEMVARNQLLWMNDNRIVFPWEKTGWLHLYALTPDAKQAQLLTPGDFEIDNVVTDGKRIVYSSNQVVSDRADIDRKHLWSLEPASTLPTQVSKGQMIETNPALLSDESVGYLEGGIGLPLRPSISQTGYSCSTNDKQLDPIHPELDKEHCRPTGKAILPIRMDMRVITPLTHFIAPKQVTFTATDNLPIHAQLFLPKYAKLTDKLPTIVFFHGGSRRQMLLGYNPMQYYAQTYELNQYFANHGYAVLSVNYRSGIGYGMEFRQAQHYGAFGGSEYLDIEGAVRWMKAQPWCDTRRIGAWGGSYGGYLTALALARDSTDFAAGVDLHGVHDWSYELDLWKPTGDPARLSNTTQGAAAPDAAKVAFEASPMADVAKWKSPVLLMQGDDDRNVLFGQTVRLAAALRAQGVTVEEKVYPDEVHDFLLHRDWIDAYQRAADFFDRHLKAR